MARFSIILPVRNGGNYVKECVASILAQTCTDFNLIVLDNASTDGTLEWIRSVKDDRIVIYPSAEPLSIEKNWARIVTVPKNEFITCIGHDDILLPGYLDEMTSLIGQYPDATLYQTHFNFIDANGQLIKPCIPVPKIQQPADFIASILEMTIDVNGTGFMARATDFERVGGIPPYPNLLFADFELWIGITRPGYKVTSEKNCFSYRLHQSMTTTSTDERFQTAFAMFVNYLAALKQDDSQLNTVIDQHSKRILAFYCKAFSHRLLRTPINKRGGLTVRKWAAKCDEFARILIDTGSWKPSEAFTVRLAAFIDSNALTRGSFLLFKKLYPKPVLK